MVDTAGSIDLGLTRDERKLEGRINVIHTQLDVRLRMKIARRVGLPLSEVMSRWTDDDVLWEMAQDLIEVETNRNRCRNCGVDPAEQLNISGRGLGRDFMWKMEVLDCEWCREMAEVQHRFSDKRSEKFSPPPLQVFYVPAQPGDLFLANDVNPMRPGVVQPR